MLKLIKTETGDSPILQKNRRTGQCFCGYQGVDPFSYITKWIPLNLKGRRIEDYKPRIIGNGFILELK